MDREELRTRALKSIVLAIEHNSLEICRDEPKGKGASNSSYNSYANEIKRLAEAYATIEKAGKEVNMYEVIKIVYGTGIKGSGNE